MTRTLFLLMAGALLLAGCATPKSDPVAAASTNASAAPPAPVVPSGAPAVVNESSGPVTPPFAFEGSIPTYVEPCMYAPVLGLCLDTPPGSDFSKLRTTPDFGGRPISGKVTATWTSSAPSNDKLVIAAFSYDQNSYKSYGYTYGASPITLDMKRLQIPAGQTFYIGLFPPTNGAYALPVGGGASANPIQQPFHLEGSFLVEPK